MWKTCRLGDVITLKRGHDLPQASRQDGDVPVVSSSGVTGYHNEAKAKGPGVITGRYGTLGEVFYVEEDYWPLNTALYVIDFKGNHPRFVAYFLQNVLRNYQSDKAAVPGVNRNVLHELEVCSADRTTQETIAEILSAYDDLIENNRRRMALLEESARQLYREWFVLFRFPGYEHTRITKGVPDGWKCVTLGSIVEVQSGFAFKSSTYLESGKYGIVTIKNVHDGIFIMEVDSFLDDLPEKMPARCKLATGDILLSLTGNIGRVCLVVGDYYLLNQRVAKLVPQEDISRAFTYFTFRESAVQKHLEAISYGVAQQNLSPVKMCDISFVLPPTRLIRQFAGFAESIIDQLLVLKQQNEKLRAARDLLLPRLMTGEIAV